MVFAAMSFLRTLIFALGLCLMSCRTTAPDLQQQQTIERQRQIVATARAHDDCGSVERLPGIYPMGDVGEKRFVYRCWMNDAIREMDACIGMIEIADEESVSAIVSVLRRNEPVRSPTDGRVHLIDTASACLSALATATSSTPEAIREKSKGWSAMWRMWAEQK